MQIPIGLAETADERLQRLENEIDELRQLLRQQQEVQPPSAQPGAPAQGAPAVRYVEAEPVRTGVFARYYIRNEPLGSQPPADIAPTVQGRISSPDVVSFDPSMYDVPEAGLFSNYRDPASYRYVGVALEGNLPVGSAGEYEFVVHPKPVREGGTNVATRLSVWLSVDDRPVIEIRDQSSWQLQRGRLQLEPGLHRIRVWAVAASDGFGPSPTASRLLLTLKGPGDVSPHPLRDLRPAAGGD